MNGLLQDFATRCGSCARAKGVHRVAVLTIALGIGVNVATFSFVDELWLHPMPVRDAHRLEWRIFTGDTGSQGEIERGYSSYPDFLDLRANSRTLAGVAALDNRGAQVDDGVQNRMVSAAVVSENFFEVLEASPALGRTFTEKEFQNSQAPSVVLSYPFSGGASSMAMRHFRGERSSSTTSQ